MINVGGDDGATAGHFRAYKFGSDKLGNLCSVGLSWMLVIHHVARDLFHGVNRAGTRHFIALRCRVLLSNEFFDLLRGILRDFVDRRVSIMNRFEFLEAPHVFANGDELHFRCDNTLISVPLLGDGLPG